MAPEVLRAIRNGRTDQVIRHLDAGGDPAHVDADGLSLLQWCAYHGDATDVRVLIAAGAQLDVRDANGDSPLGWASWHLRPRSILRLLCFAPFQVREGPE
jgi:uncharacterized protein